MLLLDNFAAAPLSHVPRVTPIRRLSQELCLPNLEAGGPDAPMPGAPAMAHQFANRTPRRGSSKAKSARATFDEADDFTLDDDTVSIAPPRVASHPQGE